MFSFPKDGKSSRNAIHSCFRSDGIGLSLSRPLPHNCCMMIFALIVHGEIQPIESYSLEMADKIDLFVTSPSLSFVTWNENVSESSCHLIPNVFLPQSSAKGIEKLISRCSGAMCCKTSAELLANFGDGNLQWPKDHLQLSIFVPFLLQCLLP